MRILSGALLLTLLAAALTACVPPQQKEYTEVVVDWRDTTFQRIADLQDRQQADSLYALFHHPDPTYRYLAARAFGSLIDSTAADSLRPLLQDQFARVRAAAAYAIGQQGQEKAAPWLAAAFEGSDTAGTFRESNAAILAATGRVGTEEQLQQLSSITTYTPRDTALLEGQAWGLYYFGLRGLTAPEGTARMVEMATDKRYPDVVRLPAANYLSRVRVDIDSLTARRLVKALDNEPDYRLRMALALAAGKSGDAGALNSLLRYYRRENDWRVKTYLLRGLGNFPYEQVRETALEALRDRNLQVARQAADYFVQHGIPQDATLYWRLGRDSLRWPVELGLYEAANTHLPYYFTEYRTAMNAQLERRFAAAASPYEKAATLQAMAPFLWNYRRIHALGYPATAPVVKSAAVGALRSISDSPAFASYFRSSQNRVRAELAAFFRQAIEEGDPGMAAEAAIALRNRDRNYAAVLDSLDFLTTAMEALELPKEIETYNELQRTYDQLSGQAERAPRTTDWNHPIDWSVLAGLPLNPRATIVTDAGTITLELWPDRAPGTVASFVKLAKEGYYNGKAFHRVVPNFVAQGGGPRGDGYGSLDFSIRTETPPAHWDREGLIGMASAGRHTEGVQFFLTHSPTPHLDGNYTIFGRVTDGQKAVDELQVGSIIQQVRIGE